MCGNIKDNKEMKRIMTFGNLYMRIYIYNFFRKNNRKMNKIIYKMDAHW